MFSFIDEFFNDTNVKTKTISKKGSFKYVNYNNEVFYLQNFKDIISYSNEEIILKLFSGEVSITGIELKINEISQKYICLTGKINKVEVRNA